MGFNSGFKGLRYIPNGSFPGVKRGRGVMLTPHPLLVPWSWKSRATPLLSLWVVRPVQSLSACARVHFTFTFIGHREIDGQTQDLRVDRCFCFVKNGWIFWIFWKKLCMYPLSFPQDNNKYSPEQHYRVGLCNEETVCSLWGGKCVFMWVCL